MSSVLAVITNRSAKQCRSRASRWDLHGVDARTGQDGVERRGELTGPVADEESDAGVRSSTSVRRFRACWVVHAPAGLWRSRRGRSPRPASSRPASAGTVAISYRWTGTVPEVSPAALGPCGSSVRGRGARARAVRPGGAGSPRSGSRWPSVRSARRSCRGWVGGQGDSGRSTFW
ncbi:MAG: hypothetical protein QOI36_6493 [Pseudonocardiales bacterium]|nr:hypothetical protein [Pseudonocardiales bacterium]